MQMERESPLEGEEKARYEEVRKSLAKRLKKACAHLSPEEFDELVEKMTKVQIGKRYR